MKSLHKLILKAYVGPFIVTFAILVFIFLTQYISKYVDDFVGKGLDANVFLELMFYFSFNMVPRAMPLAVILSALMTYGNLGQHNELTAIKSSGVSLLRILYPVFIFVFFVSVGLFLFSNLVLPKTNLKAYSLLYDMRHKKPALEFQEGMFYNGLPNYSVRIGEKMPDGKRIKDVVIYDHSEGRGNVTQVLADSGKMYTVNNDSYLILELFDGQRNANHLDKNGNPTKGFTRAKFKRTKMTFDLSSFQLKRTDEGMFSRNRFMLNVKEAQVIMDSIEYEITEEVIDFKERLSTYYKFPVIDTSIFDSTNAVVVEVGDTVGVGAFSDLARGQAVVSANNQVKSISYMIQNRLNYIESKQSSRLSIGVEQIHKFTDALACIVMFLIGAPIGAVLKKGGLGIPVLLTLVFFVFYYVVSLNGEKLAKASELNLYVGTFASNAILLPIGLFFLYQAHRDARLFEFDDMLNSIKKMLKKKK